MDFDQALEQTKEALKEQGFGVLTEVDVKATLKNKLAVDFRRYRILGACNPPLAFKALSAEQDIGLLLPCNVIVYETGHNTAKVAAIDPAEAMKPVDNPGIGPVALEVRDKLKSVLRNLSPEKALKGE